MLFLHKFVLLTSQKQNNMKTKNLLFVVAILGLILFVSCTPESLDNGQTDQQIKEQPVLQNG